MTIIDAIYERGQFFVPLSLNGSAPHHFIVDTGAGVSAVDAALAGELALPIIAHTELAGTAGVLDVNQVRIARIAPLRRGRRVDELSLYGLMPTTQDLSHFEVPVPNAREAGLLGNDYLEGFVVHMQFAPALLEIARPTGYVPAGVDPQRFVPFVLDEHNIVRVQGTLDGWMTVDLRFDTGAGTMTVPSPYVNITTAMWRALCDRQPAYAITDRVTAKGIGGELTLEIGAIESLDIGCLHFDRPRVVVQPPVGLFGSPDAPGFIALNLLEPNGWATFDYPNGRIYL
ncbi:MAG TPA: aspartyl protease family protein [Polyangia bacterium]|nr:aspartyl protease family protein [Polyangia bacterium]